MSASVKARLKDEGVVSRDRTGLTTRGVVSLVSPGTLAAPKWSVHGVSCTQQVCYSWKDVLHSQQKSLVFVENLWAKLHHRHKLPFVEYPLRKPWCLHQHLEYACMAASVPEGSLERCKAAEGNGTLLSLLSNERFCILEPVGSFSSGSVQITTYMCDCVHATGVGSNSSQLPEGPI